MSATTSQWYLCRNTIQVDTVAGERTWASGAGDALKYTIARIAKGSQYGAHLVDLQKQYGNFIQTYACRSSRTGSVHSEHAHPVAIDCWPGANPLVANGVLITNYDLYGGADGEKFLHSIMDPLPGVGKGIWQWGGGLYSSDIDTAIACFRRRGHDITSSHTDAMHFELDNWVTSSFVSNYDWDRWASGLAEEDEVTAEDLAKIKVMIDNALEPVRDAVRDLQVKTERVDKFMEGVATADTNAPTAGQDAVAVERGGFRLIRAANKALGIKPGKP